MKTRHYMLLLAALVLLTSGTTHRKFRIAGQNLTRYTIFYNSAAEPEEGIEAAYELNRLLTETTGTALKVAPDTSISEVPYILLTNKKGTDTWDYSLWAEEGSLVINGGGAWAMKKAAQTLAKRLAEKGEIARGYSTSGSVMGEKLFPLTGGANLRILDDNIWDYSAETIPPAWQALGVDPRDDTRAPLLAQLVHAYAPDVVTLQEYNRHMHTRFYPRIENEYQLSYAGDKNWNNTPIFYRRETVELLDSNYVLYTPKKWSNNGSKSFASAVFRHKATGRIFAVITTHLWYQGDKKQPGSTQARAAQVRLMLAEADIISAQHACPIFVTGDMNCYESTPPMIQFFENRFEPCYKLATEYADQTNGHHICSPSDGFSRKSRRPSPTRQLGAIDHCLLRDGKNVEVKRFECVQTNFTIRLTDHYPNVIDVQLSAAE